MPHSSTALEALCRVPESFRADGKKSFAQLVREAGLDRSSRLDGEDLLEILRSDSSLVEAWLRWSEHKRVSSGWYFRSEREGFVVAFYPGGDRSVFQDSVHACAEFIVKETERARSL